MNQGNVKEIFVVEDSIPTSTLYKNYLEAEGYTVKLFHTGKEALQALEESAPAVLIQDIKLPDMNGLDIVKKVTADQLPTITIVITSHGSVNYAVEAMKNGGFDFIEKPFSKARLLVTVSNAIKQQELLHKVMVYSEEIDVKGYFDFVGSSLAMQVVYRIIENASNCKASVFITGESGTGKELCASAIHQAGPRASKPFVAINCAAIPRELFESEIFGHIKGSFSGATSDRKGAAEQANGGTLFLDELCEMDLDLQAKLLRFIQTGTFQKVGGNKIESVDVRFVCATNRNPEEEVAEQRFREDLFYRLNVLPIRLPPLREREYDVMEIATKLLNISAKELNKEFNSFSEEIETIFLQYDWPGNVRELQNVIENIVIMNSGKVVEVSMLPESFKFNEVPAFSKRQFKSEDKPQTTLLNNSHDIQPLWAMEKEAIERAIKLCDDNIPVAATHLGVSASTLYRKLNSWDKD